MAARQLQVIQHLAYSPLADFLLFPKVKRELACKIFTQ
jgi:hypothetical protein